MAIYSYSVWFRDHALEPDEQDYEWVACVSIEAESESDALAWGDHLAKRYAKRNRQNQFLRSNIDTLGSRGGTGHQKVPVVACGHEASDDEIGW